MYVASDITTMPHTKHVDIKYKYVNDYAEDGVVKMIFVKSNENDCDVLTKA